MNNQRITHFLIFIAYLFSPSLFSWIISPNGPWYRPYLFWMGVVLLTFVVQLVRPKRQDIS